MAVAQFGGGAVSNGMANRSRECNTVNEATRAFSPQHSRRIHNFSRLVIRKRVSYADVVRRYSVTVKHRPMLTSPVIHRRKHIFKVSNYQSSSDCGVHSSDVDETPFTEEHDLSSSRERISEAKGIGPSETSNESGKELTGISTSQSRHQDVKRELVMLSLPAIAGQAVDPFVQLMETAYIGRLGPVELASAGVSISIFNIIAKLFNMPLVSVATSFVAEDLSKNAVISPTGGGFLLGRTLALLTTTTLTTSLAARQGPLAMAAHQICLQVWLAVSLLTDALAVSAQDSLPSSRMIKGSFWGQIYCKRHEGDMTPRCFICHRFKGDDWSNRSTRNDACLNLSSSLVLSVYFG